MEVKCTHCGGGGRYYFTGDRCSTCHGTGRLKEDEYCPCYGCRNSVWPRKPVESVD